MAKEKQPSLFGVDPPSTGAYGGKPKRPDTVTPVVEALKAHQAESETRAADWAPVKAIASLDGQHELGEPTKGPDVPWAPPTPARPSLTPSAIATIHENSEIDRDWVNRTFAPSFAQPVVDAAGGDPIADIEQAIGYIRGGRGVVAIQILEKTLEAMKRGKGQ